VPPGTRKLYPMCFTTGLVPSAVSERKSQRVICSARMMMWQPSIVGRIWTKYFGSRDGLLADIVCLLRGALKRWLCGPRITIVLSVLLFLNDWRFSNNSFKAFQIRFFPLNNSWSQIIPRPLWNTVTVLSFAFLCIYTIWTAPLAWEVVLAGLLFSDESSSAIGTKACGMLSSSSWAWY
jgi:hypothetical protein